MYTAKTLKELAVLKWHKEGVYSVGFAVVRDGEKVGKRGEGEGGDEGVERGEVVGAREGRQLTVAEKRIREAERTHWVAVGGKDGKVSLWAIY